tara:strand:+ start:379 stop:990 length:612 start_codon:yes stop_codon:yes gene_type:complete
MNIIQIGCHNGNDKVSEFLEINKKYLSRILLVDASPSALSLAKEFYKDFSKVEFLNFAVIDSEETEIEIFYPVNENNMSYSYCSVLESHVKAHKKFEGIKTPQEIKKQIVPATRINNLLKYFNGERIDRLYLDIEGLDCSIINDIDFNKYHIGYIRFEHIHSENTFSSNGPVLQKTLNKLYEFGYVVLPDPNCKEDLIALKNI